MDNVCFPFKLTLLNQSL